MKLSRTKIAKLLKIGNQSRKNRQSKSLGQRASFLQKNEMIDLHNDMHSDQDANDVARHRKHKSLHTRPKKKQRTAQKGKRQMNLRFKTMKKHAWHKKQFKQKGGAEYTLTFKAANGNIIDPEGKDPKIEKKLTEEREQKPIEELCPAEENTNQLYYKNIKVNLKTTFKDFIAENKIQDFNIVFRYVDDKYRFLYDLLHGDKYYLIDVVDIPKLMKLIIDDKTKKYEDLYIFKDENFAGLPDLAPADLGGLKLENFLDQLSSNSSGEFAYPTVDFDLKKNIKTILTVQSDSKIPAVSKLQYINILQKINKIYSLMNTQDYVISNTETFVKNWITKFKWNENNEVEVSSGDEQMFKTAKTNLDMMVKEYATTTTPIINRSNDKVGILWKVGKEIRSNYVFKSNIGAVVPGANDIINHVIDIEKILFSPTIKLSTLYTDFSRTISASSFGKILKTKDLSNEFVKLLNQKGVFDKWMEVLYYTTIKIIPLANEYAGKISGKSSTTGQVPDAQNLKNLSARINTIKTAVSEIMMFIEDNTDDPAGVPATKAPATKAPGLGVSRGSDLEIRPEENTLGNIRVIPEEEEEAFQNPEYVRGSDNPPARPNPAGVGNTAGYEVPNPVRPVVNPYTMVEPGGGGNLQNGGGYSPESITYINNKIVTIKTEIDKSQEIMNKIDIPNKPQYITKFTKLKTAFDNLNAKIAGGLTENSQIRAETEELMTSIDELNGFVGSKIKTPLPIGTAAKAAAAAKAAEDAKAAAAKAAAAAAVPPTELENLKAQIIGLKQEIAELKPGASQDVASVRAFLTGEDALSHTLKLLVDIPKWQQFNLIGDVGNSTEDTLIQESQFLNKQEMELDRKKYLELFLPITDPAKEAEQEKKRNELLETIQIDKKNKVKGKNSSVDVTPFIVKMIDKIKAMKKDAGSDPVKIKELVEEIINFKYKPEEEFISAATEKKPGTDGSTGTGSGTGTDAGAVLTPQELEVQAAMLTIDNTIKPEAIPKDGKAFKDYVTNFTTTNEKYKALPATPEDPNKKKIDEYLKAPPPPPGPGPEVSSGPTIKPEDKTALIAMIKSIDPAYVITAEMKDDEFNTALTNFDENAAFKALPDTDKKKIDYKEKKKSLIVAPTKPSAIIDDIIESLKIFDPATSTDEKALKKMTEVEFKTYIQDRLNSPPASKITTPENKIKVDNAIAVLKKYLLPAAGGGSRKKHRSRKHKRSHHKRSHHKRSHRKRSHHKRSHHKRSHHK